MHVYIVACIRAINLANFTQVSIIEIETSSPYPRLSFTMFKDEFHNF